MATYPMLWAPRFFNGSTTAKDNEGRMVVDPTDVTLAGTRPSTVRTSRGAPALALTFPEIWVRFWDGSSTGKDVDGLMVWDPMDVALTGSRTSSLRINVPQLFMMNPAQLKLQWMPRSFDEVSTFSHDTDGIMVTDPDLTDPRVVGSVGRQDFSWAYGFTLPVFSTVRFHDNVTQGKDQDGAPQPDPIDTMGAAERKPFTFNHVPTIGPLPSTFTWVKASSLFPGATDSMFMDPKSP
jgi:hypothetical protein